MNMQSSGRIFVEFWFSSYALISFGESIGIMFCAYFSNGGLAVSLVSAGITLLAQLNGVISASLMEWLRVIGWVRANPVRLFCLSADQFLEVVTLADCTDETPGVVGCDQRICRTAFQLRRSFGSIRSLHRDDGGANPGRVQYPSFGLWSVAQ